MYDDKFPTRNFTVLPESLITILWLQLRFEYRIHFAKHNKRAIYSLLKRILNQTKEVNVLYTLQHSKQQQQIIRRCLIFLFSFILFRNQTHPSDNKMQFTMYAVVIQKETQHPQPTAWICNRLCANQPVDVLGNGIPHRFVAVFLFPNSTGYTMAAAARSLHKLFLVILWVRAIWFMK